MHDIAYVFVCRFAWFPLCTLRLFCCVLCIRCANLCDCVGIRVQTNIRAVFDFWKKWGLEFSKPVTTENESSKKEETMARIDETFEILEKEANLLSDASTSPVKQIASAEVLALMKTHTIQPGPWEVYLSRATTQELEELDTVLTLNTKYYRFNNWDASDKGHRKCGEYFLHQYVKLHMPLLLKHSFKSSNSKRKRDLEPLQIYKQAFLCTWDLDQAAHRAVSDVEKSVLDDIWKKMETEKCLNASAFVFGKIRRLKTIHFAKNPEIEAISKSIEDQDKLNVEKLVADMVRVFKLDTMAREGLKKVKAKADLYKIAKELCDRCRHHMVANPSVHIVKLCQKAVAEKNPKKSYSSAMKSMMFRQMKLSALFAKEAQYVLHACVFSFSRVWMTLILTLYPVSLCVSQKEAEAGKCVAVD